MRTNHRHHDAASIKSGIIPYDFYLREQALDHFKGRSRGWAEAGLCPFHDDSSTGSFWIHLESGAFKCFSCSAKGGDIIAFIRIKYDLSFYKALAQLANEWGVS
jgi:DNA primase